MSNGLLELVDSPDWVFNEAFRVLNPGGIAAFSLHGRMGLCTSLRLYKVLSMRLKIRKLDQELNFDLNDPDKVKDLAKRAGFGKVLYFYEQYHYPEQDVDSLFDMYYNAPLLRQTAEREGKLTEFEHFIKDELKKMLVEREELLTYESLILIAYKHP